MDLKRAICFIVLLFGIFSAQLNAADITWTNGGGDGLWHNSDNWDSSTEPTAVDNVFFNATSTANCIIPSGKEINNITIENSYSGQVTSNALTIHGTMTQNGGTLKGSTDHSGIYTLNAGIVNWDQVRDSYGSFIINGGIWNFQHTCTFRESVLQTGGTINFSGQYFYCHKNITLTNANVLVSSTFLFRGTTDQTFTIGTPITIGILHHQVSNKLTISGDLTITGQSYFRHGTTVINGNITYGSNHIYFYENSTTTFNGSVSLPQNSTVSINASMAKVYFNGPCTAPTGSTRFLINSTAELISTNSINASGDLEIENNGNTYLQGDITVAGDFNLENLQGNMTLANMIGSSGGTFRNDANLTILSTKSLNLSNIQSYSNNGFITENGTIEYPAYAISFTDSNGYPINSVAIGDSFYITLIDGDENLNAIALEVGQVSVVVTSNNSGDSETYLLSELNTSSDTFRNTLAFTTADAAGGVTSNNGILEHNGIEDLTVTYIDKNDASDVLTRQLHISPITWTNGSGDGQWGNPVNWSSGAVPRTYDSVIFDNTSDTDCSISPSETDIFNLTIDASYVNSTISVLGQLIVNGDVVQNNGTVNGNINHSGLCTITAGTVHRYSGLLNGSVNVQGGSWYFHAGNSVRGSFIQSGGTVIIENFGGFTWYQDLELMNITINAKPIFYFSGTSPQTATFNPGIDLFQLRHQTDNDLTINGNIDIEDNGVFAGNSTTFNDNVVFHNDDVHVSQDDDVTFNGSVQLPQNRDLRIADTAHAIFNGPCTTPSGTTTIRTMESGTFTFNNTLSAAGNIYIHNLNVIQLHGDVSVTGDLYIENFDASLTLGNITDLGSGTFHNTGDVLVTFAKVVDFTNLTNYINTGDITEFGSIKRPTSSLTITDHAGSPIQLALGNPFYITLVDEDENLDGTTFDFGSTEITITNLNNGDTESVDLIEVGGDSTETFRNVFELQSAQAAANSGDGILQGTKGDQIQFSYTDEEDATDVYTIVVDTTPPSATLTINNTSIPENGGSITITATLDGTWVQDIIVNLIYSGTASSSAFDYTTANSITINQGDLSNSITLSAVNDTLNENDETVIIEIDSVINGLENGTQQETTTILDDDPLPNIVLSTPIDTFAENGGTSSLIVMLDAVSGKDVTVDFNYSGTASGSDYSVSSNSVVISAGSLSNSINFTGINDATSEAQETIIATVSSVSNGIGIGTNANLSIIDDDSLIINYRYTADLDNNGFIDAIRIVFNDTVDDSTLQSLDFTVNGRTATVDTGSTPNDNEIFLTFTEANRPDTDETPYTLYTAGTARSMSGNLLGSDSAPVASIDAAAPVLMRANSILGSNKLLLGFSEPVSANGIGASLDISDFNYSDVSSSGPASIVNLGSDDSAMDGTLTIILDSASTEADLGTDTIACASNSVFDHAGNTALTTSITVNRMLDVLNVTIGGTAQGKGSLSMTASLPIDPTPIILDVDNNWSHTINTDGAQSTSIDFELTDKNGSATDTIIIDEIDTPVGGF